MDLWSLDKSVSSDLLEATVLPTPKLEIIEETPYSPMRMLTHTHIDKIIILK